MGLNPSERVLTLMPSVTTPHPSSVSMDDTESVCSALTAFTTVASAVTEEGLSSIASERGLKHTDPQKNQLPNPSKKQRFHVMDENFSYDNQVAEPKQMSRDLAPTHVLKQQDDSALCQVSLLQQQGSKQPHEVKEEKKSQQPGRNHTQQKKIEAASIQASNERQPGQTKELQQQDGTTSLHAPIQQQLESQKIQQMQHAQQSASLPMSASNDATNQPSRLTAGQQQLATPKIAMKKGRFSIVEDIEPVSSTDTKSDANIIVKPAKLSSVTEGENDTPPTQPAGYVSSSSSVSTSPVLNLGKNTIHGNGIDIVIAPVPLVDLRDKGDVTTTFKPVVDDASVRSNSPSTGMGACTNAQSQAINVPLNQSPSSTIIVQTSTVVSSGASTVCNNVIQPLCAPVNSGIDSSLSTPHPQKMTSSSDMQQTVSSSKPPLPKTPKQGTATAPMGKKKGRFVVINAPPSAVANATPEKVSAVGILPGNKGLSPVSLGENKISNANDSTVEMSDSGACTAKGTGEENRTHATKIFQVDGTKPQPDEQNDDFCNGHVNTLNAVPTLKKRQVSVTLKKSAAMPAKKRVNAPSASMDRIAASSRDMKGEGGLGKVLYFLDQMKLEVAEVDKTNRSLQNDMKFFRDKNKELEAKNKELEKQFIKEKNVRESAETKIRQLKKKVIEMKKAMANCPPVSVEDNNSHDIKATTDYSASSGTRIPSSSLEAFSTDKQSDQPNSSRKTTSVSCHESVGANTKCRSESVNDFTCASTGHCNTAADSLAQQFKAQVPVNLDCNSNLPTESGVGENESRALSPVRIPRSSPVHQARQKNNNSESVSITNDFDPLCRLQVESEVSDTIGEEHDNGSDSYILRGTNVPPEAQVYQTFSVHHVNHAMVPCVVSQFDPLTLNSETTEIDEQRPQRASRLVIAPNIFTSGMASYGRAPSPHAFDPLLPAQNSAPSRDEAQPRSMNGETGGEGSARGEAFMINGVEATGTPQKEDTSRQQINPLILQPGIAYVGPCLVSNQDPSLEQRQQTHQAYPVAFAPNFTSPSIAVQNGIGSTNEFIIMGAAESGNHQCIQQDNRHHQPSMIEQSFISRDYDLSASWPNLLCAQNQREQQTQTCQERQRSQSSSQLRTSAQISADQMQQQETDPFDELAVRRSLASHLNPSSHQQPPQMALNGSDGWKKSLQ